VARQIEVITGREGKRFGEFKDLDQAACGQLLLLLDGK
jgi:hypothetical protein